MKKASMMASLTVLAALPWGCNPRLRVDPITVEPIHVTMDINVRLDERLDKFFAFEDEIPVGESRVPDAGATTPDTGDQVSTEVP